MRVKWREEATEMFSLLTPQLAPPPPELFSLLFAACRGRRIVKLRRKRQGLPWWSNG